jgi:hypothetical protein
VDRVRGVLGINRHLNARVELFRLGSLTPQLTESAISSLLKAYFPGTELESCCPTVLSVSLCTTRWLNPV